MSIYPGGKKPEGLRYKWDVAAIDVRVPNNLMANRDVLEWRGYLDCLSPAQQLRKLAQALDQFHTLFSNAADPLKLSDQAQIKLFSKWMAASVANVAIQNRLDFVSEERFRGHKTDIEAGLDAVIDFLKAVNSPDVTAWENRRAKHVRLDDSSFDKFLGNMISRANRENAPRPQGNSGPSSGPSP